ncbi:MAG: DUF4468 domain-containing protein [Lewinellaceae bacterium]|nr:DUF4468 domain-containing protein [Lewinellaceae bacterium]
MKDLYNEGKINLDQYKTRGAALKSLIDSEGGYPELPYDSVMNSFSFRYVFQCPGMSKAQIMQRVKEQAALSYRKFAAVKEYEDFESGKFITEGWFPMRVNAYSVLRVGIFFIPLGDVSCYHSFVFTVKDQAFKMEVKNLEYNFIFGGYNFNTNSYSDIRNERKPLESFFPIVSNHEKLWKGIFALAFETRRATDLYARSFEEHVKRMDEDYRF